MSFLLRTLPSDFFVPSPRKQVDTVFPVGLAGWRALLAAVCSLSDRAGSFCLMLRFFVIRTLIDQIVTDFGKHWIQSILRVGARFEPLP